VVLEAHRAKFIRAATIGAGGGWLVKHGREHNAPGGKFKPEPAAAHPSEFYSPRCVIQLARRQRAFYFVNMNKILLIGLAAWLGVISLAPAQDAATEERLNQFNGKLQDLADTQAAQQKKIAALAEEIRALREDLNKPNTDTVQRDELRKLAEQLKEVDDKRAADNELIRKQFKALADAPLPAPRNPKPPKIDKSETPPADPGTPDKAYEGYQHVVQSGETLLAIVQAYNKEYNLKLTISQVLKHPLNAGVKPERIRVGQKIFIPGK
jgi:outer membrane murein-binding lipoprotein Lpp